MVEHFLSPEPVVRLENQFRASFQNILATARTCYSSKGIIPNSAIDDSWDDLAKNLYRAGHHTTLQHAHFQFSIDCISRHCLWSFLHSHPFYNSEQVSQRYVEVKPGNAAVPPLAGKALEIYQDTLKFQMDCYHTLSDRLRPLVEIEYAKRFPARTLEDKKVAREIKRKSQEIARYVLPVAVFSYLYHTVSGITLLRYYRLCKQWDAPTEQYIVVNKMVEALLAVEPKYRLILEAPLELEVTPEWLGLETTHPRNHSARRFLEEFDQSLDGHTAKLVDYKNGNETMLAAAVREVLGLPTASLANEDAIELLLNPARNHLLGESLNLTTLSKLSRCLFHASYTFRKKLSHTADSQDQRHRMTPASRPILASHLTDQPDYITPLLIRQDEGIQRRYEQAMLRIWEAVASLRTLGVKEEYCQYLLPNAVAIRFTESADLLNLRHKLAMRLCYNAQEEIWQASLDEVRQISAVNPIIGKYLLPPCTLRQLATQRPICPEGERYCGERVWTYSLDEYQRII